MKVPAETIEVLTISDAAGRLDPITVIVQQLGEKSGRLIIEVFGVAWAASWGSLPTGLAMRGFVAAADPGYIVAAMARPTETAPDIAYLRRIVEAVQAALRERAGL